MGTENNFKIIRRAHRFEKILDRPHFVNFGPNKEVWIGSASRKYKIKNDLTVDPAFEIYGKGLRNSMSLAWNDKLKVPFQGENSRDAIQKNNPLLDDNLLPHEELNLIAKDHHYGWPYCYDNNQTSPEFKGWNCDKYQKPLILLPPHSAPLGMMFYEGSMIPNWYKNKLIIALHGYREKGHRLVVFENSPQGYPTGEPLSLIYNWEEDDLQKMGSPVAISTMNDGSLLISGADAARFMNRLCELLENAEKHLAL